MICVLQFTTPHFNTDRQMILAIFSLILSVIIMLLDLVPIPVIHNTYLALEFKNSVLNSVFRMVFVISIP